MKKAAKAWWGNKRGAGSVYKIPPEPQGLFTDHEQPVYLMPAKSRLMGMGLELLYNRDIFLW